MRSPSPAPRKERGEGKEKGEIKEDLKKILKDDLKGDLKKDLKDLKHEKDPKNAVNREETCPLLLRVFCSTSRHNNIQEYSKGDTPENEIQIYTWMDASLKELTGLIKEVNPDARRRGTFFEFALVYPDLRMGKYLSRDIGQTIAGKQGNDDNKTLGDCKFSIGDYMDIAISPPNQRMDRMDFGRRGGGFGGGRESLAVSAVEDSAATAETTAAAVMNAAAAMTASATVTVKCVTVMPRVAADGTVHGPGKGWGEIGLCKRVCLWALNKPTANLMSNITIN